MLSDQIVSKAAIPETPGPQLLTLNLIASSSNGNVDDWESPSGRRIDCYHSDPGSDFCRWGYQTGAVVVLRNYSGNFLGWGGACAASGTNRTCTLIMASPKNVTANYGP